MLVCVCFQTRYELIVSMCTGFYTSNVLIVLVFHYTSNVLIVLVCHSTSNVLIVLVCHSTSFNMLVVLMQGCRPVCESQ